MGKNHQQKATTWGRIFPVFCFQAFFSAKSNVAAWREGIAFANFDRCNDLILERMGEIFWYQQREDGKVSSSISFFSKWNYTKDAMDMNKFDYGI